MNNRAIAIVHTSVVTGLLFSFPLLATGQLETELGSQIEPPKSSPVAGIFRPVIEKIKVNTKVPILLPSELPASVNVNKIHFVDGEGKTDGYEISLNYEQGCGQACFAGYFAAERGGRFYKDEADKIVQLAHRVRGYYSARSCGVSCTPPQIGWLYKGVLYTIQFNVNGKNKTQDENDIVALANSAIQGGERR